LTGILWAALALLGIIVGINLLLTFALVRRLTGYEPGASPAGTLPDVGTPVGEFTVRTDEGQSLGLADLRAASFSVIFMMTGCRPCHGLLSELSTRPIAVAAPAVVFIAHHGDGNDDAVADYRRRVPPGALVAVISPVGDVARAFGVQSFPAVLHVEAAVVAAAGRSLDVIPRPAELSPAMAPSATA